MNKVKIYTVDYCPYCKKAKMLLEKKGISYEEIDITNQPDIREKLVEMTGGRTTVPQIFINGKSIGGSSDLEKLISTGQINSLLNNEQ
ncbi:MAG: glutaredoxin 3 [bacterium]